MFQHRAPREQYAVALIALLLLAGAGYVGASRLHQPGPLVIQPATQAQPPKETPPAAVANPVEPAPTEVVVHVSGAVKSPGLKRLKPGARVDDAIKAAGGAKANADLDRINLAARLEDSTVVYVPPKGDKEHKVAPIYRGGREVEQRYAPDHVPAPRLNRLQGMLPGPVSPVSPVSPPADIAVEPSNPHHRTKVKAPTGPVSLNTGTAEELQTLPGIGPATAQKILDYRKQHGPFTSIDGLIDVKGVGPKKMEKLRQWLKL